MKSIVRRFVRADYRHAQSEELASNNGYWPAPGLVDSRLS
jgi:hypothetical protein